MTGVAQDHTRPHFAKVELNDHAECRVDSRSRVLVPDAPRPGEAPAAPPPGERARHRRCGTGSYPSFVATRYMAAAARRLGRPRLAACSPHAPGVLAGRTILRSRTGGLSTQPRPA